MKFLCLFIGLFIPYLSLAQEAAVATYERKHCPANWFRPDYIDYFGSNRNVFSCYKFVRSPKKSYGEAEQLCKTYQAELVTLNTNDEHGFIISYLYEKDPLYRTWYVGVVQKSSGYWENEDGTPLLDSIQKYGFLRDQAITPDKRYLAYSYSYRTREWGLLPIRGDQPHEFICEINSNRLSSLILDAEEERDNEYGLEFQDHRTIPRAPKIIRQPESAMFDLLKRDVINFMSIQCLADGYPPPTYNWFREIYESNNLTSEIINPLLDDRFTVSGGTLIINRPKEIEDRGNYFCIAENKFGSVVSQSVQLSFAYMAEFNLKRSDETGNQNWGKAIYCDPPRFFPDARFYWNRDFFPNFVEEDKRTFVSFDGNLYFSYLDNIDQGRYSCTVQSTVSDIGRHGPFFNLDVSKHPNYQTLKFANNFPKAFPDSPVRGNDVRLECISFGYPVPHYNWTRRNGDLPRRAKLQNYNRVLILPDIQPADVGEYVCHSENTRLSIEGRVSLSIQAKPNFTIPLRDMFISEGEDIMMECEAFAIPDADYSWLRNSKPIDSLAEHLKTRYEVQDNVFKIQGVTLDDEATYQCKATNQLGSTFSSAQLKVLKLKPTFRKRPVKEEIYAAITTNITIYCRPEAAPAPEFTWTKDGLRLGSSGTKHVIDRNGALHINMVNRDDRGVYNCTASNKYGKSSSGGRLIVLEEPVLDMYPEPKLYTYSEVGKDLRLFCKAKMDEILDMTYVWSFNELRIEVDKYEDPYYANRYVEDNYFSDFYSRRRADASLFHDRERLQSMNNYVHKREPPYIGDYHPGTLVIRNLTLDDTGFYMCNAKTPIANISYTTKLLILGPPGPIGGISALGTKSTSTRLRWVSGAENGDPISAYTIQGLTEYSDDWKDIIVDVTNTTLIDAERSEVEFRLPEGSLTPMAGYKFRIRAQNRYGNGVFSSPSPMAKTKHDLPFVAPSNVGGGGGKTGDLTITWTPLAPEDENAAGVYYKVFWRRQLEEGATRPPDPFKQEVLKSRGNIHKFVTSVETQFFYSPYEVKVQSANSRGWGPVSDVVVIYSAEDMPQVQPTEVKAFAHNATSLNITWRPIEPTRDNIRGKLIGYRLKYWRESDSEILAQIRLNNSTQPHGLVVGLVPNTFYWVRVMAYNSAGSGPESEKFRERTWRNPPLTPPNAVQVSPIDPETIFVTWRGMTPTSIEEALLGYKVRVWQSDQDMTTANDTLIPLGQALETYVSNLEIGKMYKLRVLAYSLGGDGKMSSPPIHFSMGDPQKLRAGVPGDIIPMHLLFLFPLVILFRK